MKIHEYQAKEVLSRFGVPVPRGQPASTPQEAVQIAQDLGGGTWVVKAQIHAGGRGKGGGVKLCSSIDEVKAVSASILGMLLVTPQTGPQGRRVQKSKEFRLRPRPGGPLFEAPVLGAPV